MNTSLSQEEKIKRGAEDSGPYFRYMTEFVGFTEEDAATIRESALIIEKHLPEIVAGFYDHLLRYPPTRKHFLKEDGSVDQEYVQKRMHHLTNFWRRTAGGVYDEDYARYVDYVGRAHTSHGADPKIYIAERYVIGQVGFVQYGITKILHDELHEYNEDLEKRAIQAWGKLMMVILEMLSRAYNDEHEVGVQDKKIQVDWNSVHDLAIATYELGLGLGKPIQEKEVRVAGLNEIPDGERKIVQIDNLSVGLFHHKGNWYAIRNHCLHRGGPVATGCLEDDTITCPWHGYQYNVITGQLLVDPSAKLATYPVIQRDDGIYLRVPDLSSMQTEPVKLDKQPEPSEELKLKDNEFLVNELQSGQIRQVYVEGKPVAVFNVNGSFYATQKNCTHAGGPLNEGTLKGKTVICPWHGSCFDVTTGEVQCGPADEPIKTYSVVIDGTVARVQK